MLARRTTAARASEGEAKPRSLVHIAALVLVWITFATSGIVFSEPCPTDILALGVMVLLPVIGLVRIPKLLALFLMLWAAMTSA